MAERYPPARLRARARTSEVVDLTVIPSDGRYPETFRVGVAELRRFCWSTLADLEPVAAAEAAAEQGATLGELCAEAIGARSPRRGGVRPTSLERRLPPGSKKRRLLEALDEGLHTTAALKIAVPDAGNVSALISELFDCALVRRMNGGGQGVPALWGISEDGRAALAATARSEAA